MLYGVETEIGRGPGAFASGLIEQNGDGCEANLAAELKFEIREPDGALDCGTGDTIEAVIFAFAGFDQSGKESGEMRVENGVYSGEIEGDGE